MSQPISFQSSERSTPSFSEFNPFIIRSQARLLYALDFGVDYSLGAHEFLLSGTVGSAKSLVAAHAVVKHCLRYTRARVMLGRRTLPDLKATIFQKIVEHLEDESLVEGKDYWINWSTAFIRFRNGSEIISKSWADKKFKKFRSLELSAAVFEELTENNEDDMQAYMETKARVGRLSHIKERWIISCTNPDGPRHWAYTYFIIGSRDSQTRHVIYSKADYNPFLPQNYIQQLRKDLDPKQAARLLDGEWVEIDAEKIYHAYSSERNFLSTVAYKINPAHPIVLNFDFNIGHGKPMSSAAYQYIDGTFHVFDKVIVEGFRTLQIMEEWLEKGIFGPQGEGNVLPQIIVHGDASGDARDTRSMFSDYDLIKKFLEQHCPGRFKMEVPRANPPIRTRHNKVNAHCLNSLGEVRLFVYKGCDKIDEGFRLTTLAKGSEYQEDDSKDYQHVTTALGYGITYDSSRTKVQMTSQRKA